MINYEKSFIEVQFPVSKVSKESFKERKAVQSQTLTGLGKWWGRKPLILVRAAILGLIMPVSSDSVKDREIFLKILSMDEEGLWQRKNKSILPSDVFNNLTPVEQNKYFEQNTNKISLKKELTKEEKEYLQKLVFNRLSYDEKLRYCFRAEELEGNLRQNWQDINNHLGTNVQDFQELIKELGVKRFGKVPTVGDCFAGGGSIPFEAARIGCNVFASDLNPIAVLLTWSALNISGSSKEEIHKLREFQEKIFNLSDKQITEWKIEHNEQGHRANAYIYLTEVVCPECGYKVPLAPTWLIGMGSKTVAILNENDNKGFDIEIISNASKEQIKLSEQHKTLQNGNLMCPHCKISTAITAVRKDRRRKDGSTDYGLPLWGPKKFMSSSSDVLQERLYCIRYEREYIDSNGSLKTERYYQAPSQKDMEREQLVFEILEERFEEWQNKGYIPSSIIEKGDETTRLMRERGWNYWHQLFTPRQILIHGLLMELTDKHASTIEEMVIGLLGVNRCCNWNSKLCSWGVGAARESIAQTFYNQALNTIYNYGCKGLSLLKGNWLFNINSSTLKEETTFLTIPSDASCVEQFCDIWVTDPPYADAVNYHELSEFFLAWNKKRLLDIFPDWYTDSKRALAVKGTGETFNQRMIEIYKNLAYHMPENGMQIVMFTHQNVSVWADLTMILWSAGLRVTAAWNIATETDASGIKDGNYVKGTVLLVLRKQDNDETAYLDELYPAVEEEVKRQIDSMRHLDDKEDPNFTDTDYLLASYAASLKILTSYKQIEDIDIKYELSKPRRAGEESPIEKIISEAIKIAYDYLTPVGFDSYNWKLLTPEERFYIKGLDFEKDGVNQIGAYQELARGFGVKEYKDLLASIKANQARLKTAIEFGMRGMGDSDTFGSSLLRNVLAALHQSIKEEDTSKGRNWLKNEVPNYWNQRNIIIELLDFIISLGHFENMKHWEQEANYARLLRELVKNDGI